MEARKNCSVVSRSTIGDGWTTLFWEDRWLDDFRVQDVAPGIYDRVDSTTRASRTVFHALSMGELALYVGPELTVHVLNEFMNLWVQVDRMHLTPGTMDSISWACEASGGFSIRTAYEAKFMSRQVTPTAEFTWKLKAPL